MIKPLIVIPIMDTKNQNNNGQIKNSEYKELVDFLGVKFENIDRKFENIDRKFDEINEKLDQKADKSELIAISSKVDRVLDRVVRMSDKVDDYRADQIGMRRDIDRHEKWHFKVADKVGVDLLKN